MSIDYVHNGGLRATDYVTLAGRVLVQRVGGKLTGKR